MNSKPLLYLGNGIAIPHGTTDTRDLVQKTGVQVYQFTQGVDWGDGQIAYFDMVCVSSSLPAGVVRKPLPNG